MGKLFDKHLKAVLNKQQAKPLILPDGKGLGARVSAAGKVRWQYRYKLAGKNKRLDFGDYPDISLLKARDLAQQCREWLAEGYDPKLKRDLQRQERIAPVTVEDALEYWLVEYAEQNRANAQKHRSQFERHIYPYIGRLPLADTETRHWIECFDRIRKGVPEKKQKPAAVAAGYIMQNAKQALRYCRVRRYAFSRELDDLTICDVGKKQAKRDRVLSHDELVDVWRLSNDKDQQLYHQALLKILIVFGARTQEVRLSTWGEWDFEKGLWTVPKAHSKTSEKIIRPIPKSLYPWLQELRNNTGDDYILGELRRPESVSQHGRLIYKKLGHDEPWTLHDLRRTFATRLNELGVMPHVVEQLLGHSLGGVMAIYNRSQYLPEKERALELWLERLALLMDKPENLSLLERAS